MFTIYMLMSYIRLCVADAFDCMYVDMHTFERINAAKPDVGRLTMFPRMGLCIMGQDVL